MAEVRTFSTEMQIEAGATADYDLEVDGYYDAPVGGRYLGPPDTRRPPEPPRYRIFQARARTLSSRPAIVGRWVDLPMSLGLLVKNGINLLTSKRKKFQKLRLIL